MITEAILTLLTLPVRAVLALLPVVNPPDAVTGASALSPIFEFIGWTNQYLPIQEALTLLGTLLIVWGVMYGIQGALWVLRALHITAND